MQYRRAKTPGATYFFTVITYKRNRILCILENVDLLRKSFWRVMQEYPFKIDAFVLLPEHLHCIWTLPENDADFSNRWRLVKNYFSRQCREQYQGRISVSRKRKGEKGIWQRRFWEHQIRDEEDFAQHVDYIHYNPVRHGLVKSPKDWEYSSFHRYVRDGVYPIDWGSEPIQFDPDIGME
ncbi:MAG: transposase [Symploca sp. SIO2D2]|nr:transposase [Symploca sp. SIO2D2]